MLEINKNCWDVVAPHFLGAEALPEYGPLTVTEDEIELFDEIKNRKVLDIGCGSGHSLEYMARKGADELWGIDLSSTQIEIASNTLQQYQPKLFCSPMEVDCGLPKNYYDIVYSIYAIGWTSDLPATLELVYSYLKNGGSFIFSWDHPFHAITKSVNGEIIVHRSYHEEGPQLFESFKGEQVPVALPRRKLSTYINELIKAGFKIEKVVEGEISNRYKQVPIQYSEGYYTLFKTNKIPNTFIIKARK